MAKLGVMGARIMGSPLCAPLADRADLPLLSHQSELGPDDVPLARPLAEYIPA